MEAQALLDMNAIYMPHTASQILFCGSSTDNDASLISTTPSVGSDSQKHLKFTDMFLMSTSNLMYHYIST